METNGNRNDATWDAFEEMMENKVVFTVPIDESVKAGVVTSLKGVRAFIPASQLSTSYVEDVSEWIGKEIDVVIITADRENSVWYFRAERQPRSSAHRRRRPALRTSRSVPFSKAK